MKVGIFLFVFTFVFAGCKNYEPVNGDIIFQTSLSSQSKAIQLATKSPYSHMGIVYIQSGKRYVYEASQTVKLTPLDEWIKSGEGKKFVVKRLKEHSTVLTEPTINKMIEIGRKYCGKPYDLYFEWSDERIYCSELVWKIYESATKLRIGDLKKLKDFDLTHPEVIAILKKRYGDKIPEEEVVISPESMYKSKLLYTVYKN